MSTASFGQRWGQQRRPIVRSQNFAVSNGMVVVTHDLDFGALLAAAGTQLPSVIQIRADDLSVEALGAKLAEVVNTLANELSAGALVTLDPPNIRFRVLPIIRQ